MATNGSGITESLVHAPTLGKNYSYRSGMGMIPSAEWEVFFDDFAGSIATNVPVGWAAAIIDTGATVVKDATATSALYFDSDGTTEGAAIYLPKGLFLTVGKRFFMEMRFKTEVADDSDVQFGLSDLTATVNPEDLWTTTAANVIAFGVLDGDATVGLLSDASNGGTSVQLGNRDLVSGTWHTLAISYDKAGLRGWVDGKLAVTWSGAAATIPTATALAPFVGWRNGSAATTEGQLDYVRYVLER